MIKSVKIALISFLNLSVLSMAMMAMADSSETAPPAETLPPDSKMKEKIVADDFLIWELELAENSYSINKNLENRTRLLSAYEKITAKRCMPSVHADLSYRRDLKDNICTEFIANTLELDNSNPIAICAADGLDHPKCVAAYKQQDVDVFDPNVQARDGKDTLEQVLENKRNSAEIYKKSSELLEQLEPVVRKFNEKKDPKARIAASDILAKLLRLNCSTTRIKLDPAILKDMVKDESNARIANDDELIEESLSKIKPAEKEDPFAEVIALAGRNKQEVKIDLPKSYRSFQISKECSRYIARAKDFQPDFPLAICYSVGFYSPDCISALRNEKAKNISLSKSPQAGSANQGSNSNASGVAEF